MGGSGGERKARSTLDRAAVIARARVLCISTRIRNRRSNPTHPHFGARMDVERGGSRGSHARAHSRSHARAFPSRPIVFTAVLFAFIVALASVRPFLNARDHAKRLRAATEPLAEDLGVFRDIGGFLRDIDGASVPAESLARPGALTLVTNVASR